MSRALLQQALDALTVLLDEWTPAREAQLKGTDAIAALREALAAPEPDNDCTPNHLCNGRMVHLPSGEQCDRCGHE